MIGVGISSIIIIVMTVWTFVDPPIYNAILLSNGGGEGIKFDNTYKAYLTDEKYGELYITYENALEDWTLNANFKKAGKTEIILESPGGEKTIFDITIKKDTYKMSRK